MDSENDDTIVFYVLYSDRVENYCFIMVDISTQTKGLFQK